jgi:two-component system OmpR family sensor kinase
VKRPVWPWLLVALPLLLGLILSILFKLSGWPNPSIYLSGELSAILFVLGLLVSLLAAGGVFLWQRGERLQRETAVQFSENRRRFLHRLDHELKNPLTAILAGLANVNAARDKMGATAVRSVEAQAQRLRRLVADLRKLSDLETRPIERAPVDLTDLLEDAYAVAQEMPEADGRQLTLSIPRAPWPLSTIAGDRDLLFLAIYNLLNNALKFTQPGDTIEMRASENNAFVLIEVADTGPGIPENELPYVWQELYRGRGARGIPGSGLGLALVRAIVVRHGGQIGIRSRPGQGTQINLRLPLGDVTNLSQAVTEPLQG